MLTYVPSRYPKDLAATLMSTACVEHVLLHDHVESPHAWEAEKYGAIKRNPYSGPKTRGSMARNRSGQVVVSLSRMAIWEEGRPKVTETKQSPLWAMLRQPRALSEREWSTLEPATLMASQKGNDLLGIKLRADRNESLLMRLACCGTFDAIAGLCSLYHEAKAEGRWEFAFQCALYLPPAIVLLGPPQVARRSSLLIFATLRRHMLDSAKLNGEVLDLSRYDIPLLQREAEDLPSLMVKRALLSSGATKPFDGTRTFGYGLVIPRQRAEWVTANLPATRSARGAGRGQIWRGLIGPMSHPKGACAPSFRPSFHPLALDRFRRELGKFA